MHHQINIVSIIPESADFPIVDAARRFTAGFTALRLTWLDWGDIREKNGRMRGWSWPPEIRGISDWRER